MGLPKRVDRMRGQRPLPTAKQGQSVSADTVDGQPGGVAEMEDTGADKNSAVQSDSRGRPPGTALLTVPPKTVLNLSS